MSKEKLNTTDIAQQLARVLALDKHVAEEFLKALISTIEENLLANDNVKLKGLGTFKLQWNDPRKSVDVNTGDEIMLEGYYKVVFVPEDEVKVLVNEPYAHLEPISLDDNNDVNEVGSADEKLEETVAPLKFFNEQATEIKDILSEINALNSKTVDVKAIAAKDDVNERLQDLEVTEEEVQLADEVTDVELAKDEQNEDIEEVVEEKKDEIDELKNEPKEEKPDKVNQCETASDESANQISEAKGKNKNKAPIKKGSIVLLMFVLGMIIGGALIYMLSNYDLLPNFTMKLDNDLSDEIVKEYSEPDTVPVVDTLQLDTVSVVDSTPIDSLQLLFDEQRVYTDFIASEKVVAGSRLTRIALRHYGVKEFWVYIYEANKDKFTSPDQITPGTVLKIPKLNPVLADKNNPRCMEYALKLHDLYVGK